MSENTVQEYVESMAKPMTDDEILTPSQVLRTCHLRLEEMQLSIQRLLRYRIIYRDNNNILKNKKILVSSSYSFWLLHQER